MDGMIYSLSCFRGWLMETISCRAGSREKGAAAPHRGREMLPLMMLRSGLHVLEVFPQLKWFYVSVFPSPYNETSKHHPPHLCSNIHTCQKTLETWSNSPTWSKTNWCLPGILKSFKVGTNAVSKGSPYAIRKQICKNT